MNFPKVPFLLNSRSIPLLGFLTLLTRIKSQDVQVSDYFFVVSKSSLGTNTLFLQMKYCIDIEYWVCYQLKALQQLTLKEL